MEIKTLNDIYDVTCTIDRPAALKSKREGRWVDVSVGEFRDTVRHFATGLRLLGVKPGDRVLVSSTKGSDPTRVNAIALVAGLEALAAPRMAGGRGARGDTELPPDLMDLGISFP